MYQQQHHLWVEYVTNSTHLKVAEPDAPVEMREGEDMVEEGLALGVLVGHVEALRQHLLGETQHGARLKVSIERDDGTGAFQAVASHAQLGHRVNYIERRHARDAS